MRNKTIRIVSLLIATVMTLSMVGVTAWATDDNTRAAAPQTKYEKLDINKLTNMGQDPEELSVSTTTQYFEKEWYEFITYSQYGVATLKIDSKTRIKFYDPYDYMSSMVMEVTYDDEIGWSSANSVTVTHEFSKSFSTDTTISSETSSSTEKVDGIDKTVEIGTSYGESLTTEVHSEFSIGAEVSAGTDVTTSIETSVETTATTSVKAELTDPITGSSAGTEIGTGVSAGATTGVSTSVSANVSASETYSESVGNSVNMEVSDSLSEGWDIVADRITSSSGSSNSTSTGWSTTESVSISRTFEAAYFNSNGAPLQWTIAHYEVKMPMKAELQYKINGKWVTIDTDYVLLTTMCGSCRAWQENSNVYYESWATGEPVTDADFWSGFFTKDGLKNAYQTKLYPTG